MLFDCRTAVGPTIFHTVVDSLALTEDYHALANKTMGTASFIIGIVENVHSIFRAHRVVDGCVMDAEKCANKINQTHGPKTHSSGLKPVALSSKNKNMNRDCSPAM